MKPVIALLLLVLGGGVLLAQPGRPKAELTPVAASQAVHAGSQVRLALQVRLPEGIHVQAHEPLDPLLIATVLTLDPPVGTVLVDTVYPRPIEFKLAGQSEPLAVFEAKFAIGVTVSVAADASGTLVIPGRFRYQACDASTCFAPTTEQTRWTLPIAPASDPIVPQFSDVFSAIEFKR